MEQINLEDKLPSLRTVATNEVRLLLIEAEGTLNTDDAACSAMQPLVY